MKKLMGITIGFLIVFIPVLFSSCENIRNQPEWSQSLKKDLVNMADSLTAHLTAWQVPDTVFRVEDYGAIGDSLTMNTDNIQNAIDICSVSGGGVVLLALGNYVTGKVELKSGVMLEIAHGARLLGSINLQDYPEYIESFKSVMSENHKFRQSLIYAENCHHIGIRGKGEIYFRGERENFPGPQTIGEIFGRPFGIRMVRCESVVIQDILLKNAAAWMQSYIYCRDLIFDGMRVENHANYNNDGLDLDGCTHVIVRNCFINSEDDALCLKGCSGQPTRNVLIENSTFFSTCNGFKIGTDTQGPFSRIIARQLLLGGIPDSLTSIAGNQASTGITLATVDGGNVNDIYMQGIEINQARCPIFIRIGKRLRVMPGVEQPSVGHLQHVLIENVTGNNNFSQGSFISGIKDHPVEHIVIRNYNIKMQGGGDSTLVDRQVPENETGYPDAHQFLVDGLPAFGFYTRYARHIRFENVKITPSLHDHRPEFLSGPQILDIMLNN